MKDWDYIELGFVGTLAAILAVVTLPLWGTAWLLGRFYEWVGWVPREEEGDR